MEDDRLLLIYKSSVLLALFFMAWGNLFQPVRVDKTKLCIVCLWGLVVKTKTCYTVSGY